MYPKSIFPQKDALSTLIITVLGVEYPLSKMQLFNKIKSDYRKKITYQGVSKIVAQLTDEGILAKQGRIYSISSEWIAKVQIFAEQLAANYGKTALVNKNTTEITFHSLGEFVDFVFDNLNNDFFDVGESMAVQVKDITFVPLSKRQISQLTTFAKSKKLYITAASNSLIEKAIAVMLRRLRIKVKLGIDCAKNSVVIATEGCLMNVYVPHDLREQIAAVYKETKSFSDLKLIDMYRTILHKPVMLYATVSRNKALAQQVLHQTMAFWHDTP